VESAQSAELSVVTDELTAPALSHELSDVDLRLATESDIPVLQSLIEDSARALSSGYYTPVQIEAAIRHVFGVDSALIADRTYFVVQDGDEIVACGGWSRRRTLYGGDQRPVGGSDLLDPAVDAARIRAFFVAPSHARRGIGRMLVSACALAADTAGFRRLELMATLPGVPLYRACGFSEVERVTDVLPDGTSIEFVRMERAIDL
jgi:GNAT superfamily N-acetyltransferase